MTKPTTLDGYSDQYTRDCERVLVTLLRGLLMAIFCTWGECDCGFLTTEQRQPDAGSRAARALASTTTATAKVIVARERAVRSRLGRVRQRPGNFANIRWLVGPLWGQPLDSNCTDLLADEVVRD